MRLPALGPMLAVGLLLGCGNTSDPERITGSIEVRWTGADSGRVEGGGTAEWCGERRLLEIRAIRGDTGVAMALYSVDTVEPGNYRVVHPDGADSVPPSAGLALRVFASSAIQGFQGDSGIIVLERSGSGELSGTLDARARSVVNGKQLTLTGKFRDLTVVPQSRGCVPDPVAGSADTNTEPYRADVD